MASPRAGDSSNSTNLYPVMHMRLDEDTQIARGNHERAKKSAGEASADLLRIYANACGGSCNLTSMDMALAKKIPA